MIIKFIKKLPLKIWSFVNNSLSLVWKIVIPVALVGLLALPIFLTYFSGKKTETPSIAQASVSDLIKKVNVQGTIEYTYQYDLPVYQDARIIKLDAKIGDKVTENQVLAELEFVQEIKVRATTLQNQIRQLRQELANNQKTANETGAIANATNSQNSVALSNRLEEKSQLIQKRNEKSGDNWSKISENQKIIDDNNKKILELEPQIALDKTPEKLQNQIQVDSQLLFLAQGIKNDSCNISSLVNMSASSVSINPANIVTCDVASANLLLAQVTLDNSTQNFKNYKNPITIQIEGLKAQNKISQTIIDTTDLSPEVKLLNDQIVAKENQIQELSAAQKTGSKTLEQTISGTKQRQSLTKINLGNAQTSLNDVIEDMETQNKNRNITAKKSGIVTKVTKLEGLSATARENIIGIASGNYRLKFQISPDTMSNIKLGQTVQITDKYKDISNIKITEFGLVPEAGQYVVYADLIGSNFISGETVSIDVILEDNGKKLSIPSTAVNTKDGKTTVFVGKDIKEKAKGKETFGEIEEVLITTGANNGLTVAVDKGISAGDYVFAIYPKTQKDQANLKNISQSVKAIE